VRAGRAAWAIFVVLLVAAAYLVATRPWRATPVQDARPAAGARAAPCAGCNVLLIVLDAARADHFALYGYERATTPRLERLAREAVVFDRAYAEASYTVASVASLLTGLPPGVHGVDTFATPLAPSVETLAESFAAARYRTAAFVENPLVGAEHGFAQGFERFVSLGRKIELAGNMEYDVGDPRRNVQDALAWAAEDDGAHERPFFLYLHLLRPHSPYFPLDEHAGRFSGGYAGPLRGTSAELATIQYGGPAPDAAARDHLVALYDENVLSADALVGQAVDALAAAALLDETIVVVTSDHGEEFLEHGRVLHGWHVFEESVRVPLVVRFPPRTGIAGERVQTPVQLADVAPTLLAAVGATSVAGAADVAGTNLLPLLEDPPAVRAVLSQSNPQFGVLAYREGELKLVRVQPDGAREPRFALYDLAADPHETTDLAAGRADEVQALARRLEGVLARRAAARRGAGETPLSEERTEMLRALGYVE
jgi:arylsulfatase A-like enzyme